MHESVSGILQLSLFGADPQNGHKIILGVWEMINDGGEKKNKIISYKFVFLCFQTNIFITSAVLFLNTAALLALVMLWSYFRIIPCH